MAADKPKPLKLQVVHGPQKYEVELIVPEAEAGDALCVNHLMKEVFNLTKIPPHAQRLIYKGKSLKDSKEELSKCGLKEGSKVMLIGSMPVPEDDETVKAVKDVEKNVEVLSKKLSNIIYELDGIHQGYLDKKLRMAALTKNQKQLTGTTEHLMKCMERLDGLICKDNKEALAKRKSVISRIQVMLDRCDGLSRGIDELKEKFG